MRSNSNIQPSVLLDLKDGSFHYNFNIVEKEESEGETTRTVFDYDTVTVQGAPDYRNIVKEIIRDKYDASQEFGLMNDFQKFKLGIIEDPDAETKYLEFANWVEAIKMQVKSDLEKS